MVNVLQEVRDNEYVKNVDLFEHDFQRIIDRLLDDSFRVAVVGEFSSGKSTFLNALLGKDLLKHGAKETTATITEIHNGNSEGNETYLDVYYLNGKVESYISAERIMDYTATASTTHAVAQEIEKVVINSRIIDSDARVCFVDTPGLNGVADNHREKTIEEIKNAHACIYLMQVRGLGQSDIDFLKYIRFLYKGIIIKHNKTEPTYTKTSLFLCEKRRFLWPGLRKGGIFLSWPGREVWPFFISQKRRLANGR